jgi:glucose/arabinose dehydrogenase
VGRFTRLAVVVLAVVSTGLVPGMPARAAGGTDIEAEPVLTGLQWPAAFAFRSDGSIYYGNRDSGVIRLYNATTGGTHLFFRIPGAVATGGMGLLGLTLHPDFHNQPFVYAYATRKVNGTIVEQILRIRSRQGVGASWSVIFSHATAVNRFHYGGPMVFGAGGLLFVFVGDGLQSSDAQDLSTPAGKILRMTAAGKAPGTNVLGHRIFTRGVRNSFGMAVDPDGGGLWETENGPECNDELNRFSNGANGGWGPRENCAGTSPSDTNTSGPKPRTPPLWWTETTIAPTGMAFCPSTGCGLPGSEGHLFFGDWNDHAVHEATLDAGRLEIGSESTVLTRDRGILSMQRNPVDGVLYFSDPTGIYRLVSS